MQTTGDYPSAKAHAFVCVAGFVAQTLVTFRKHDLASCFECTNGNKTVLECFRDQAIGALVAGGAHDYNAMPPEWRDEDEEFYRLLDEVRISMEAEWPKITALAQQLLQDKEVMGEQILEILTPSPQ